ncbi:OmpA family protein [Enterobacter cloacae]|uniref:OmpA family protein n=1 Tax=Enterobacter cloacae TaxID=550 RepID=UPI0034CE25A1
MTKKKNLFSNWTLLAVILVTGCTRTLSDVSDSGKTASPEFPQISSAVRAEGSYVPLKKLSLVRDNMTKAQIYELMGAPHFHEGVLFVKEWDYILHFDTVDGEVITCQYKITFDDKMKARGFYFKPDNCLAELVPSAEKNKIVLHKDLSAESLFAFGSANPNVEGESKIKELAKELLELNPDFKRQNVVVTGYTDRFGDSTANETLSYKRAMAVKSILVKNGVPSNAIRAYGMGENSAIKYCAGPRTPAVVECLAPNRRVTVELN